jgi:hypothetical protein
MHVRYVSSITYGRIHFSLLCTQNDPNTSLFSVEKKVMLEMVYKGQQNSFIYHYKKPENRNKKETRGKRY